LNGIKDSNYASKVSYDIFKSLGRIYERRYQKDVQEGLGVLSPILSILDLVFVELSKKQYNMKKSIQNSFMMAYAESSYLDSLIELDGQKMQKSLDLISKFNSDKLSLAESLISATLEIKQQKIFDSESNSYTDILYSLTAAKRKIERQLDWSLCSLNKQTFPLIRNNGIQTTGIESLTSTNQLNSAMAYSQDVGELQELLHKKLKQYSDNNNWKTNQTLSLLIKNNSKTADTLYLDSKSIPDANDLKKVLLVPQYFKNENITAKKLAKKMKVKPRMASYYLDAAEMLGIMERNGNSFKPTDLVKKLDKYSGEDKNEIIHHLVQELPVIKAFFLYLESISKTRFTIQDIAKFLEYSTDLSPTTARRRASTISSWLKAKKIVRHHNDLLYLKEDSGQTYLSEFIRRK